jgi:hypothetical protein
MAFAGQNVLHAWQPMHPCPMKYTLVPLAAFVTAAFVSAGFAAAIEPAAFKSNGEAIAAELNIINFLLLKLEFVSVIIENPPFNVHTGCPPAYPEGSRCFRFS